MKRSTKNKTRLRDQRLIELGAESAEKRSEQTRLGMELHLIFTAKR
jgi:hypothetical protein